MSAFWCLCVTQVDSWATESLNFRLKSYSSVKLCQGYTSIISCYNLMFVYSKTTVTLRSYCVVIFKWMKAECKKD